MLIFKKEEKVRKLILEHLSNVHNSVTQATLVMKEYLAGDTQQAEFHAARGKEYEHQADVIKVQIRRMLNAGAFLPQIRADVHSLVDSVDKLSDSAEKVATFLVYQTPDIPGRFEDELQEILTLSASCFNELRKGMKDFFKPKGKIETLHEHVRRVGQLESEIDSRQASLERQIFASDLELAHKLHLSELIDRCVRISDRAERVSDLLESAVMRSVV